MNCHGCSGDMDGLEPVLTHGVPWHPVCFKDECRYLKDRGLPGPAHWVASAVRPSPPRPSVDRAPRPWLLTDEALLATFHDPWKPITTQVGPTELAVERLPEAWRDVLVMRAQGMTIPDIAAHLGLPERAVEGRLRRARRAMGSEAS